MKLKYITQPSSAGGTAVSGCGTIHISEIEPTLEKLSDDLGLPFDLYDYMLGSTGKREYSGDIDLVLDTKWWNHGAGAFRENLIELYGIEATARNGELVHLRFPIQNYNESLQELQPRTGYVQIDFNFGNADWERLFHYSAGSESEYKGAHRNIAISAICSLVDTEISPLLDFYDRPISTIRWKWSPKGFMRVDRFSVYSRNGKCNNKQQDTIILGPFFDPKYIANTLFPETGLPSDLDSLETIMTAVKHNFGIVDQERIWKRIAKNFKEWKYGKDFIYPEEINRYFVELF